MRRVMLVASMLLLAAVAVDAARPKWNELEGYTFNQYVKDFGRHYKPGTDEYRKRESIFNSKIEVIRRHNRDATQTWKRGVNMFTDMSNAEWKRFNALKKSADTLPAVEVIKAPVNGPNGVPLPKEVDYRTWTSPRVLTAVKHQGSCGNCWAHAATESLESYFSLLTGRLPVLSTQQITSCTPGPNCQGCNGGYQTQGWMYINSTVHGETEEWPYPFTDFFFNISNPNAATSVCKNVTSMYPNKTPYTWFAELTRVGVNGFNRVTSGDAISTMYTLATTGPLAIDVAAGNWQDYESGVFQNSNASGLVNEWQIDHAVQMVGYGFDKELGRDYWIVRNSWSTNWGEDGFIRLDRPAVEPCNSAPSLQQGTACGTSGCLTNPSYPLVKELTPTDF